MSSPPHIPRICSAHPQPAPREPTYTADTYKPPSLYPNKKQKTEALEPVPPYGSVSFVSPPSTTFDSPVRNTMSSNITFSASNPRYTSSISRRQSIQRPETLRRARSPPRTVQGAPPRGDDDVGPINPSLPHSIQQYGVPERLSLSASSHQAMHCAWYDRRPFASDLRRFSASRQDEYYPPPLEEQYNRNVAQQNDRAYPSPNEGDFRRRDGVGQFGRVEHDPFTPAPEFIRGSLQSARLPDGFVPAPYEYYYTKARKRSNLPKHSTEIMRAWFDQVLFISSYIANLTNFAVEYWKSISQRGPEGHLC